MTEQQEKEVFRLLTTAVSGIQKIEGEVAELKSDVAELKTDVADLRGEFHDFREETSQNFKRSTTSSI